MSNKGSFERLIARIPGFKGYQEKQARRNADSMLREHIARELDERLRRFVRIEKLILETMGLSYMTRSRDVKGKVQLYRDKITAAMPGYDGMWAQMKIEEEELEQIYAFDEAQIMYVDKIDVVLDTIEQAALQKEGLEEALYELDTVASEAIDAFDMRADILTNFGKTI